MNFEGFIQFLEENNCAYFVNEPMKNHTTFKIGGEADIFVKPTSVEVCQGIIKFCNDNQLPITFFGGGSNVLVSDFGIKGVVLHTGGMNDMTVDGCEIYCSAGVKLSKMCAFALENSLSGLEFGWGIPGTVGGAVFMNAGAYGGEIKDVLVSVDYINSDGEFCTAEASELKLGYRTSIFQKNNALIVGAKVRLAPKEPEAIRSVMNELLERRKSKQPVDMPCAGSVFKRPEGHFAGTLIEQEGLKGERIGGAVVSEKHAGFIVNDGDATCSDVLRLVELIKERVFSSTGVQLECEIKVLK